METSSRSNQAMSVIRRTKSFTNQQDEQTTNAQMTQTKGFPTHQKQPKIASCMPRKSDSPMSVANKFKTVYFTKKTANQKDEGNSVFKILRSQIKQRSGTSSPITPIYLKTNTGATVKAHVDNSLIKKGATPCVFLFDESGSIVPSTQHQPQRFYHPNRQHNNTNNNRQQHQQKQQQQKQKLQPQQQQQQQKQFISENNDVLKGKQDVFLPQIEESQMETGFDDIDEKEEEALIPSLGTKDESSMVKHLIIKTGKDYTVLTMDGNVQAVHPTVVTKVS